MSPCMMLIPYSCPPLCPRLPILSSRPPKRIQKVQEWVPFILFLPSGRRRWYLFSSQCGGGGLSSSHLGSTPLAPAVVTCWPLARPEDFQWFRLIQGDISHEKQRHMVVMAFTKSSTPFSHTIRPWRSPVAQKHPTILAQWSFLCTKELNPDQNVVTYLCT